MRIRLRTLIVAAVLVFVCGFALYPLLRREPFAQARPDQFEAVTVYAMYVKSTAEAESAVLTNVPCLVMDQPTLARAFGDAKYETGPSLLWKSGGWVCTAKLRNGESRRLVLSHVGYFVVLGEPGWYEFDEQHPSLGSEIIRRLYDSATSQPASHQLPPQP